MYMQAFYIELIVIDVICSLIDVREDLLGQLGELADENLCDDDTFKCFFFLKNCVIDSNIIKASLEFH